MANERVLKALLKFGVDPKSVDEVRRGVKSVEDALDGIGQAGQDGFDDAGKAGGAFAGILTGAVAGAVMSLTTALIQMASQGVDAFKQLLDGSVEVNKQFETYTTQFETFLKSRTAAESLVGELQDFNIATPFELDELVKGATSLQTFGGAQLNVAENWKLVGDAAASVNRPFEQVAFWTGRLYSNLQAGRPFGEAAMAMQEMGVMSGQLRTKLEDMEKAGASSTEIWEVFSAEIGEKFEGGAERLSKTLGGIESNLSDMQTELMRVGGEAYFEQVKEDAQQFLDTLGDDENNQNLQEMARGLGEAAGYIQEMVTSGLFQMLTPEFFDGLAEAAEKISQVALGVQTISKSMGQTDAELRLQQRLAEQQAGGGDREVNFIGRYLDAAASSNIAQTITQVEALVDAQDAYNRAIAGGLSEEEAMQFYNDVIAERAGLLEDYSQEQEELTERLETGTTAAERARAAESARYQGLADSIAATEEQGDATDEATISLDDYTKALDKVSEAEADLETDTRRKESDIEVDRLRELADIEKDAQRDRMESQLDTNRDILDNAEDLAQKRVDIAREAAQKIKEMERELGDDISDASRDYARDIEDINRDLARSREDINRDFARQVAKNATKQANERLSIEEDYQQRLKEIRRDFEDSAEDALRNQDAIAFVKAQRNQERALTEAQEERDIRIEEARLTAQAEKEAAEEERQQALEDAKIAAEREREDAAIQREQEIEDLRLQFERELEEQRLASERKIEEAVLDAERKHQEILTAAEREREDLKAAEEQKQQDLEQSNARKLEDLKKYYNRRKVDLRQSLEEELALINEFESKKRQAQSQGISAGGGGANYSGFSAAQASRYMAAFEGRQSGGYASRGLYALAEDGKPEYVMNAQNTRQVEQALGGQITSAGIAEMASRSMSIKNEFNFTERDDARAIMSQVERVVNDAMLRNERGF